MAHFYEVATKLIMKFHETYICWGNKNKSMSDQCWTLRT